MIDECEHPDSELTTVADGSVVCNLCGVVLTGAALEGFHRRHGSSVGETNEANVQFPPAGETSGYQHVGPDGRARSIIPRGASATSRRIAGGRNAEEANKICAEKYAREVCGLCRMSPAQTEEIVEDTKIIVERKMWNRGEFGRRIVGAIVASVCRKYNRPITLKEIASIVGCKVFELSSPLNRVTEVLGIDNISRSKPSDWIERAVELYLSGQQQIEIEMTQPENHDWAPSVSTDTFLFTPEMQNRKKLITDCVCLHVSLSLLPSSFLTGKTNIKTCRGKKWIGKWKESTGYCGCCCGYFTRGC